MLWHGNLSVRCPAASSGTPLLIAEQQKALEKIAKLIKAGGLIALRGCQTAGGPAPGASDALIKQIAHDTGHPTKGYLDNIVTDPASPTGVTYPPSETAQPDGNTTVTHRTTTVP